MTASAVAAPRTLTRRVSPVATLRHTATLAWRSLVQIKHNPMELIDLSIQPIMFVVLFAYVFGGQMAGGPTKYLQFALPGIIAQNAMFATMNTGFLLNTDLTKGVFDRLRSLPIGRMSPLAGRIVADTVKQAWSMAILIAVGMIIGFRVKTDVVHVVLAFLLLLAFALAFSWIAVLIGVLVSEPDKVMIFGFTTVFPLSFTSSAFARVDTMPGWLQAWVKVNPVTHLADATRGLMNGGAVASPVLKSLVWAAGIAVVFAPLAVRALRRRV
ncbi:ABC transporter permease [Actinoallomurus liliacearum]|uniref:Transport permease protein n=1 Tax=Actinoallomurus liliacearum TaxID=1080073 RepID=A0ABP8TY63_9ACTN